MLRRLHVAIVCDMKLSDLTPQERRDLAEKAGTNQMYLYQCGAGIRQPSPELAKRLMRADPRLTWESFYGPIHEEAA